MGVLLRLLCCRIQNLYTRKLSGLQTYSCCCFLNLCRILATNVETFYDLMFFSFQIVFSRPGNVAAFGDPYKGVPSAYWPEIFSRLSLFLERFKSSLTLSNYYHCYYFLCYSIFKGTQIGMRCLILCRSDSKRNGWMFCWFIWTDSLSVSRFRLCSVKSNLIWKERELWRKYPVLIKTKIEIYIAQEISQIHKTVNLYRGGNQEANGSSYNFTIQWQAIICF